MAVATLGMRGAGSFVADERPKNWRQMILLLFPNGDAPLTALLSKLREQPTSDPQYQWFEKGIPVQRAQVVGAKATNPPASGDVVAANGVANEATTVSYALVRPEGNTGTSYDASIFKVGHTLINETTDEVMLVVAVDTTYQTIALRRDVGDKTAGAGTQPALTGNTSTGDWVTIIGSGHPEGAAIQSAVSYPPIKHFSYTQIFRTPLFLTRTARRTALRYDQDGAIKEAKREALQLHAVEMERAFLFGERSEITAYPTGTDSTVTAASSNQPLRTTRGLLNWLPTASTTATASVHWDIGTYNAGGLSEDIFEKWLEEVFRYGSSEKLAFCGSTVLNVLNQMAKNKMVIQAVPTDRTYGMRLNEFLTPFGTLMLKQHPLMSHNSNWRKDLFVIDVDKLTYRYIDDTKFLKNRQAPGDDASKDEFLTEAGLECQFSGATPDSSGGLSAIAGPAAHGRLKGVSSYVG
jgi:hypothetical protein